MTQPVLNGDSSAASASRHATLVFLATQILGRVLAHNGVIGVDPDTVGQGAELVIDGVSALLSGLAGGIGWLLHRKRTA